MSTEKKAKNTIILYAKVQVQNKKWLESEARANDVSLGTMLDLILSSAKTQKPIRINELFSQRNQT
jgi:hypothetical protein